MKWKEEVMEKRMMNFDNPSSSSSSSSFPFAEEKYVSKLDYPYLLFIQIQRVLDAIDAGGDGMEELENLKAILKPSWKREIENKMEEKKKEMDKEIKDAQKEREKYGIRTYRERKRRAIVKYVREYVQCVIAKLDEVGLLLIEERTVLIGGGTI